MKPRQIFISIFVRALLTFLLFLLAMVYKLGTGAPALITALVFLLILLTPGVICHTLTDRRTYDLLNDIYIAPLNHKLLVFAKFATANIFNITFVLLSTVFMYIRYRNNLGIAPFLRVGLALILLHFALASLSMFFSMVSHRILSFTFSYAVSLALISNIFLCGVLIERLKDQGLKNFLTALTMHTNPAIMAIRSFGKIDILRTQYLYNLADPIVGRGFSYPEPYICWVIYLGLSIIINGLNFIFVNRYFKRQI